MVFDKGAMQWNDDSCFRRQRITPGRAVSCGGRFGEQKGHGREKKKKNRVYVQDFQPFGFHAHGFRTGRMVAPVMYTCRNIAGRAKANPRIVWIFSRPVCSNNLNFCKRYKGQCSAMCSTLVLQSDWPEPNDRRTIMLNRFKQIARWGQHKCTEEEEKRKKSLISCAGSFTKYGTVLFGCFAVLACQKDFSPIQGCSRK